MKRLLQESCSKVSKSESRKLTDKEYENLQKRYQNILTSEISELPKRAERPCGKRGRLAQCDAQNLWERLFEHEYAVLLFEHRAEVLQANEQTLHPVETQRFCGDTLWIITSISVNLSGRHLHGIHPQNRILTLPNKTVA